MRVVLALGNPGDRYRDSRHNVGWWLADRLARRWNAGAFRADGLTAWTSARVDDRAVEIHKPLTYMNRSGEAVRSLAGSRDFDPGSEMLALVDDVALAPGTIRLRAGGSPGGHNGLASISRALGEDAYHRLRIGVGRPQDPRIDLADWVLSRMTRDDEEAVVAIFPRAVDAVECWLESGIETAMSRFNAVPEG